MILQKKPSLFKLLEIIIFIMVGILIIVNLLYIKEAYFSKQRMMINVLTIILLVWATAFWLAVIKYSDKK
ncbi:MAG: hypothetical protein NTV71_01140 [Candidatus Omnitrophica bacterium]|nr:hypothetical protein [Candidatus Omnitrophota bacterium]